MSPIRSTALVAAALTAALVGTAAPAVADPVNAKNSVPVSVTCDNGQTYETVANGNARFSPAHDVNSTATLVPVSFGPETFTVTDPAGNVVDQGTDAEGETKGASGSNPNATLSCTYMLVFENPDGSTITIEGTVAGFATPVA